MADAITIQALQDASLDAKSLEEVVNGNDAKQVTTRLGETYPSVKKAIKTLFENGGLPATPFKTKALMTASSLANDKYAMVTDGGADNGLYVKTAGAWVKSGYDPVAIAKTYADTNKLDLSKIGYEYVDGNKIGPKTPRYTNLGISGGIAVETSVDSLVLSVNSGDVLFILNDKGVTASNVGARIAFFADDPNLNRTQTAIAHTSEVISVPSVHWKITVPSGAKYLMMNTRTLTGSGTHNLTWAVHKDSFNASFVAGKEVIVAIQNVPVGSSGDDIEKAKEYTDAQLVGVEKLKTSTKNLFNGSYFARYRLNNAGTALSSDDNDAISQFIPVEFGETYTISGLNQDYINRTFRRINGYGADTFDSLVKSWAFPDAIDGFTVTIDDPAIKYILFPLSSSGFGTLTQVLNLPVQVEQGDKATAYEPYEYSESSYKLSTALYVESLKYAENVVINSKPLYINEFVELNKVRDQASTLEPFEKNLSPTGISYELQSNGSGDNASNNLYTQVGITYSGTKGVYVNLMKYVDNKPTLGSLNISQLTIPSGQLDNGGDTAAHVKTNPKWNYCHPSIAYDAVGVGGFKYWMITSILPGSVTTGALWEDEDLFVSNDANSWQRVRSMHESDKSYTTAQLRLPPQTLVTNNSRKYAFLPVPNAGDTIELSMPAYGSMPEIDRQTVTLIGAPFKHDPCILIDGGYVYTYHAFHLPYVDRVGGSNKFFVCVRTNDGINWEVVRSDGSTMLLTEETSRQIFTKDEQGRYNYTHYTYLRSVGNPEVIKWGDGDYELFWGENFNFKFSGSTPYTFDFSNEILIQDLGFGNHPGLLKNGNDLYAAGTTGFYKSTNRGISYTKYPKYPFWLGGVEGIPYKKAMCIGAGGKVVVADIERFHVPYVKTPLTGILQTGRAHGLFLVEYPSLSDLINKATNGLNDAYVDIQLCKINHVDGTREFLPVLGNTLKTATNNVNNPLSSYKVADMVFKAGDKLHIYATLNARQQAKIVFGGIDIS